MANYPPQPPNYGAYDPPPPGMCYPGQQAYYPPGQPYPPQPYPGVQPTAISQPPGVCYPPPGQPPTQTIIVQEKKDDDCAKDCFICALCTALCCFCCTD